MIFKFNWIGLVVRIGQSESKNEFEWISLLLLFIILMKNWQILCPILLRIRDEQLDLDVNDLDGFGGESRRRGGRQREAFRGIVRRWFFSMDLGNSNSADSEASQVTRNGRMAGWGVWGGDKDEECEYGKDEMESLGMTINGNNSMGIAPNSIPSIWKEW